MIVLTVTQREEQDEEESRLARHAIKDKEAFAELYPFPYIEPAWHFVGHCEDGTQLDVLIQAIKQEFLLPERVPSLGMG